MAVIVAAVLGLAPLVIAPHFLLYYDVTPKLVIVLLGSVLALLCFAWSEYGSQALLAQREGCWFAGLLAAAALSLVLSTALSANRALSLGGTNWRRLGLAPQMAILVFALLLACWLAENSDRLRNLLRAIAVPGIFAGLYGILQYFGWDPWLPAAAYHVGEGALEIVRPPATLGHAISFANYELYVVFYGCALAVTDASPRWRALGAAAAAVAAVSALLSGTRAAVPGLLVGAVFLAVRLRPRLTRRTLAACLAAAAGAALFYVTPPGARVRGRVHWTLTEEPLGGARTLLWRDSLAMAARHWATGYGPETFSKEFPRFQSVQLARAYPDSYHESPHNILLDVFTAQGALGVVPLVGLIALAFAAAWKGGRVQTFAGAALAAGVASHQFAVFTVPTALYFFATLAICVAQPPLTAERRQHPTALMFVAVAIAALLAVFAVRLTVADRALAIAAQQLESGGLQRAVEAYELARKWQPSGAAADLWFSRKLAAFLSKTRDPVKRIQAWPRALEAAVRATSTSEDRHNAWYNLAAFYAAQNDAVRAEAALRSAVACAPAWFKPHWMLAQVLDARGTSGEALREAVLAEELNGGRNPEVAATVERIRVTSERTSRGGAAPPGN